MSAVIPPTEATHFACLCGELFAQDEALIENCPEPSEFWGASMLRAGHVPLCPHCGGEQLEDAWMCPDCGIRRIAEGLDQCNVCFAITEAEQDANVTRAKELERELNRHWTDTREEEFHEYANV